MPTLPSHDPDSPIPLTKFMLSPDDVKTLMVQYKLTAQQLLMRLVRAGGSMARPPISGFHVGAVGLGASGSIYIGVNLEFKGATLGQSVHAEQFLVVNALRHKERQLRIIVVSAGPCGHCRQFLSELASADSMQIVFGTGPQTSFSVADLLPHRFGPQDLNNFGPFILDDQYHSLSLTPTALQLVKSRINNKTFQDAVGISLNEAQMSYAPYTGCRAGVAIISNSGGIFGGRCLENAAHNPTMPPLQAALISGVVDDSLDYSEITEVVLVEGQDALVSYAAMSAAILNTICPGAVLTVLNHSHFNNGSM